MKKTINYTLLLSLIHLIAYCQNEYVVLPKNSTIELTYKMGTDSFVDRYTSTKETTPLNTYSLRIRTYSWGESDTALFREDKVNFYAASLRSSSEYIEMPKKPVAGQFWYNGDSSWVYTIKRVNAELATPSKTFMNLIELEARQAGQKYDKLFNQYLNYYCLNIGYVGSIIDNKLYCYLTNKKTIK